MFLVGLTGGIAAGKSAVAELWHDLGAEIIDADELAREVVQPGSEALLKVVEAFGNAVLAEDGSLNRKALASVVFSNPSNRRTLEQITHPLISKLAKQKIHHSEAEVVVYAIPLLVESNSQLPFDFVVTVEAPIKDQIARLVGNRGMTESEATARIAAQATPTQRANAADRILSSNQTLKLLLKDARQIWLEIVKLANAKDSQ